MGCSEKNCGYCYKFYRGNEFGDFCSLECSRRYQNMMDLVFGDYLNR